jgi:glycosyltransferase involved in cell wall biosynthesis
MKLSIIVPHYKDPLINKTVDDIIEKSELGDIEVLVVLDGDPVEITNKDPRVKVINLEKNLGMRGALNAGFSVAKGEFMMKSDAHCLYEPGFDRIMAENCDDNWILIPRRYSLDEVNWVRREDRPVRDYHYFAFPNFSPPLGYYDCTLQIAEWNSRTKNRWVGYDIDDTMAFQGSCIFVNRKYFMDHVGLLDDRIETYGNFAQDQEEIGLKYWLGGGEVKVIKKTWYAHLSKREHHYSTGLYNRQYKKQKHTLKHHIWSTKHWMNNEEPNMMYPLGWLIEKFWPVPTWPDNWQEIWDNRQ